MRCPQHLLPCPSHHDELDLELGAKASLPLPQLFLSGCSVIVTEKRSAGLLILSLSLGTQSIMAGKSQRWDSETVGHGECWHSARFSFFIQSGTPAQGMVLPH